MALKCTGHLHCNPRHQASYSLDGELEFIRCNDCGLIWRSPGSAHISKEYGEEYFESKNYGKNRTHKIKKSGWLLDIAIAVHPGIKSLLEVGCSLGNTLEAARQRKLEYLGIDISQYAVDYCRDLGLNAEKKTLEQLRDEGGQFDLIFMQHVLEHFEDPFHVISICRELLKTNGLLLILVPNSLYRSAARKRGKHRFYSISGVGSEHYVYFNYDSILKVLESEGFRVVRQNYPVCVAHSRSVGFCLNRIFRKGLSLFHADQEILVMATLQTYQQIVNNSG